MLGGLANAIVKSVLRTKLAISITVLVLLVLIMCKYINKFVVDILDILAFLMIFFIEK